MVFKTDFMSKPSAFQIWMAQFRANFLLLAVLLVFIGVAAAWKMPGAMSGFDWLSTVLLAIGVVSAHISVNLFNEYSDYHTRIDFHTNRTPFSGGTGLMVSGQTTPRQVLIAAVITLVIALVVGTWFSIKAHWSVAVMMVFGALSIVLYTPLLARIGLGELVSGVALGSLVVVGSYVSMTASPGMSLAEAIPMEVWWLSVAPGILTALLLFFNEFPDADADRVGGRRHLVIVLGRRYASWLYVVGLVATFAVVGWMVVNQTLSNWGFLALLPLPLAIKAGSAALVSYNDIPKLIPGMGANVMTVLATDLLLGVAVLLG